MPDTRLLLARVEDVSVTPVSVRVLSVRSGATLALGTMVSLDGGRAAADRISGRSRMIERNAVAACLATLIAVPAVAEPVKIGMVTTLSTNGGYLGEDIRDGFQLAIEQEQGKLGGVPVELLVEDDEREPETGRQAAQRLLQRERVAIMTGIVFSNVAMAVVPKVVRDGVIYISANAGPSQLAGEGCHENYFNVAWQNDNLHQVTGQYVRRPRFPEGVPSGPQLPCRQGCVGRLQAVLSGWDQW